MRFIVLSLMFIAIPSSAIFAAFPGGGRYTASSTPPASDCKVGIQVGAGGTVGVSPGQIIGVSC